MRILFVSHTFPLAGRPLSNVGGMQRVAVDLHAALEAAPEVQVVDRILRASARWTALRTVPFLVSSLATIPALVRREGIDVVLFSSMVTGSLAPVLKRSLAPHGCRMVSICHGLDVVQPSRGYQAWLPRVFRALDAVAPVSSATGRTCVERGMSEDRVRVIPNGIDPSRFPLPAHPEAVKTLRGKGGPLPPGALLLCSVGRHVARKGFDWFVDQVMPRLPPNVHYWIAGDGPKTPDIRAAIERHGLSGRVKLLGRIGDRELVALYASSHLFIMPNVIVPGDMEGFGVVMLEAGLCGLPSLASSLEGIRDVITEGLNGHLLPAEKPEAYVEAVARYDEDRAGLERIASGTRAFILRQFTWPAVAGRFVRLFEDLGR